MRYNDGPLQVAGIALGIMALALAWSWFTGLIRFNATTDQGAPSPLVSSPPVVELSGGARAGNAGTYGNGEGAPSLILLEPDAAIDGRGPHEPCDFRGPETPREWREMDPTLARELEHRAWMLTRLPEDEEDKRFADEHWAPTQENFVDYFEMKLGREITRQERAALQQQYFVVADTYAEYLSVERYRIAHPNEDMPPTNGQILSLLLRSGTELAAEEKTSISNIFWELSGEERPSK